MASRTLCVLAMTVFVLGGCWDSDSEIVPAVGTPVDLLAEIDRIQALPTTTLDAAEPESIDMVMVSAPEDGEPKAI